MVGLTEVLGGGVDAVRAVVDDSKVLQLSACLRVVKVLCLARLQGLTNRPATFPLLKS